MGQPLTLLMNILPIDSWSYFSWWTHLSFINVPKVIKGEANHQLCAPQPGFNLTKLMVLQKSCFQILIALSTCEGGCCKNVVFISSAVVNGFLNCAAGRLQFAFVPKKVTKAFHRETNQETVTMVLMGLELLPAVTMASFSLGVGPPQCLQTEGGSPCLSKKKKKKSGKSLDWPSSNHHTTHWYY